MRQFLMKKNYDTKDNKDEMMRQFAGPKLIQNRFFIFHVACMLMIAFVFLGLPLQTANAASSLKIYDYATKKTTNYTDKQVKVTLNGKQISVNKTPGILVDGVSLVSYVDIFKKSGINANCVYDKSKGTITISNNNTTIVMTLGSKTATVNGKSVTLTVAPKKLKFPSADVTKIYVPSRFVSENLGLGYTWNSSISTVAIVKNSLQISYGNVAKYEYTGTQGKVSIDGKNVDLGNMPSIIINNTAMLRAKKVFSDSSIGAKYKYNKSDNSVTLSKDGNVLVMTIGSKTAYLNKNKITLDTAPIIVKNHEVNQTYVMVPGSITTTCLGYDYTWNQSTRTSMIVTRTNTGNDNSSEGNDSDPELGDSGDLYEEGFILNQLQGSLSLIGKSTQQYVINNEISNGQGVLLSVNRDYNNTPTNAETFAFVSSSPFEKITSSLSGKTVSIQVSNMYAANQTYSMDSISSNYVNNINTEYQTTDLSSIITLNLQKDDITYDIALSDDKLTLYVTVYVNSLTSVTIGTNDVADYITLEGLNKLNETVKEENGYVYIDLPYTGNSITEQYTEIKGAKHIKSYYTVSYPDKLQIVLDLDDNFETFITNDNNKTRIFFITKNTNNSNVDKSKYQIVIPRPSIVTKNMVSDVDDYFNNKISIKLQGDYTAFFNKNNVSWNSSTIKAITVNLNSSNETVIQISTNKLQGYEYFMDNDNIYVRIGNPRDIYKNIVVLDPGHGGGAPGAIYFNTKEKDINYTILYQIGKKYFNSNPSELKVYYTRTSDVDMTLSDRAGFANKIGADLFVSLHMNASTASGAYGTEVYYSKSNTAKMSGLTSEKLATIMVNNLTNKLGTSNRGAKAEQYTVVHKNTVPAILIELGFLSNKNDHALITNPEFQEKAVKNIYETILEVFQKYPTGR